RAQGLGLTGAAFGLGFIFGPIISIAALEFSDNLGVPALIAAVYSFISILTTLFVFRETHTPQKRSGSTVGTYHAASQNTRPQRTFSPAVITRMLWLPGVG